MRSFLNNNNHLRSPLRTTQSTSFILFCCCCCCWLLDVPANIWRYFLMKNFINCKLHSLLIFHERNALQSNKASSKNISLFPNKEREEKKRKKVCNLHISVWLPQLFRSVGSFNVRHTRRQLKSNEREKRDCALLLAIDRFWSVSLFSLDKRGWMENSIVFNCVGPQMTWRESERDIWRLVGLIFQQQGRMREGNWNQKKDIKKERKKIKNWKWSGKIWVEKEKFFRIVERWRTSKDYEANLMLYLIRW